MSTTDVVQTLAEELADWACSVKFNDIESSVVAKARLCVLDYVAVALAGSSMPLSNAVSEHIQLTTQGESRLLGGVGTSSPEGAALANGTAASTLDYDDGHSAAGIHPAASIAAAAWAVAEEEGRGEKEFLSALCVGYEIACRLGREVSPLSTARGFQSTPLIGVFGAAAAAAVLKGSGAGTVADALGIAGSFTGGLFDFTGGWMDSNRLQAGRAGREGVLSASLALRGLGGAKGVFEGRRGLFAAYAGDEVDALSVVRGIGEHWELMNVYHKPYPCCRKAHAVVDAALLVSEEMQLDRRDIDEVIVQVDRGSLALSGRGFDSYSDAQMSIPFCVGAALTYGRVGVSEFSVSVRGDAAFRDFVDRIRIEPAAGSLGLDYDGGTVAQVAVHGQGMSYSSGVIGEASRLAKGDVISKASSLIGRFMSSAQVDAVVTSCLSLGEGDQLVRDLLVRELAVGPGAALID